MSNLTNNQKKFTRLALEKATVKVSTSSGFKGTGFLFYTSTEKSYILTAWHCISESVQLGTDITVSTIDNTSHPAQINEKRSIQELDLAVLTIDTPTPHYCVPLGLIKEDFKGNAVIAVGFPAGYIEDRGLGVYEGMIHQLITADHSETDIPAFETNVIEGAGQSGGMIYHYDTNRLIGLAAEIYKPEITKNTGRAICFHKLFENWPELYDINQGVAEKWDDYLKKGPIPITQNQLHQILDSMPDIKEKVAETESVDWPVPVFKAIHQLNHKASYQFSDNDFTTPQDYFNVFNAMIHLHFVSLASQFYWAFSQHQQALSSEEVKGGLGIIHESLLDSACGGSMTWLRRSAVLSLACQHFDLSIPELAQILDPKSLTLGTQKNTNEETQDNQTDFWFIKSGGERWQWLKTLAHIQKQLEFYEPFNLDETSDEAIQDKLDQIFQTLTTMFQPYRGKRLALVDEKTLEDNQQRQVVIHCYWHDNDFVCVKSKKNYKNMRNIWPENSEFKALRAPEPPRPDWRWNESLVLYESEQPSDNYIYLMPLGYRYRQKEDLSQVPPIPALLDSIRWKNQQVADILQRTYQEQQLPDWHTFGDQSVFKQSIERFVQELCENFAFQPPLTDTQPIYIPPQFDLQHDHFASQLAENSVFRQQEVTRVLSILKSSHNHRLLLEGASGVGKTVLACQIFQSERQHAIFVSMDAKLEPLEAPEKEALNDDEQTDAKPSHSKSEASVALRVVMYCLTVLNRIMDLPQPTQIMGLSQVQDAIRNNLHYYKRKHPKKYVIIIVDGLNQALDPGGIFGAVPTEKLDNLFLLVSSQPHERVRQALNIYTQKAWHRANIHSVSQAEACLPCPTD